MSSDEGEFHLSADEQEATAEPQGNELAALKAEVADLKDRLLRALAETQNVRRIAEREKTDATQYAVTRFARDMLTIADNFGRALAACPPDKLATADAQ